MSVRGLVCRARGHHHWNYMHDVCKTCKRTAQEIVRGVITDEDLVNAAAYGRGVKAGCVMDEHNLRAEFKRGRTRGLKEGWDGCVAHMQWQMDGRHGPEPTLAEIASVPTDGSAVSEKDVS